MLRWTVIFLIIALISALFGFGDIAAGTATTGKFLFFVFFAMFFLSTSFGNIEPKKNS
ncbi:DUF1328 domain-containing protein [Paraflavitalea sp. CAU 1676]|uniref:DUF1328 domain-containing protein n=1 Tax=Paraflavitalea sp. CAU 1676 TaxID=3032598 RepID=UPI0023DB12F3|nr:DUF1328 domain-containing protein [Paraflavitalea sp. CAU 1676]MDF2190281.1 DUF1328 domain-containing protein [Paraflavitalea sp. CAU 1676]